MRITVKFNIQYTGGWSTNECKLSIGIIIVTTFSQFPRDDEKGMIKLEEERS